jgi:predicted DNA-binding transcriptional regulator YafY
MFHLNIECERKGGYHYYIDNVDEIKRDGLRNWLWRTLSMSNLLLGSQAIKDRIILESIPSGQENLAIIVDAMKTNTQLTITYQSYWRDEPSTFTVYPYCVKLFKQRWYLVALSPYYEKVMIYALDRIKDMEVEDEHFVYPDDFDPDSFFEGCIGVIVDEEYDIETVRLKVSAHQSNYIRSLPMHSSQKEIERNDDYSIFTFEVRPTFDFQQEILMNGADMEVLSPERLRNEIAEKIENMSNNYKK